MNSIFLNFAQHISTHILIQRGTSIQNDLKGSERRAKNKGFLCVIFFLIGPPFSRKNPFFENLYSLLVDLHRIGIRLLVVLEGKGTGILIVSDREGIGFIVDLREGNGI